MWHGQETGHSEVSGWAGTPRHSKAYLLNMVLDRHYQRSSMSNSPSFLSIIQSIGIGLLCFVMFYLSPKLLRRNKNVTHQEGTSFSLRIQTTSFLGSGLFSIVIAVIKIFMKSQLIYPPIIYFLLCLISLPFFITIWWFFWGFGTLYSTQDRE